MPIQDEKVSINDILIERNSYLREEIIKKLSDNKVQYRITATKLIFDNYNIFHKDELIEIFKKLALDENDQVKSLLINFLIHNGEKIFQKEIEIRRDLVKIILNNINNMKIKNEAENFLAKSYVNSKTDEEKPNFSKANIGFPNNSDFNQQTLLNNHPQSNQSITEIKHNTLEEYILCVTLWMGGDGAIFNASEIAYHLPFSEDEIRLSLEKLKFENILLKRNNDYSLTEKGSVLADSSLIKIIAIWHNISEWINNSKYKTIHHGFLKDKRNTAISNLSLSSRSFITDFFHVILENIAKFYNNKNISYFTEFRTLLIWLSLNPTTEFIDEKNNQNCSNLLNNFLHDDIIKIVDYNHQKVILINNEYFKRKNKKATKLESVDKW